MNLKRYVLEMMVDINNETKVETWKHTNLSSNDPHALFNFLSSKKYRIFDTELNWVYKKRDAEK